MASTPGSGVTAATAARAHPAPLADHAVRPDLARPARLPMAAAVAALVAAATSYAPVLVLALLATAGSGSAPAAVARTSGAAWLLGQGVPVRIGGDPVSLAPLAIGLLALWRVVRAGVHASRAGNGRRTPDLRIPLLAGAAVAVAYAVIAASVAAIVSAGVPIGRALALGLLAWPAATAGALVNGLAGRRLIRRVPILLRRATRTGLAAAALVLATGAATAGAAVAVNGGDAAEMLGSYRAGIVGQAGLTLVGVGYAPTMAVWATSYLLGPGFAVGAGTVVSPGLVVLGPVPAAPALAGLPATPLSGLGLALLGLPLVAAMIAGHLAARRPAYPGWWPALASAALAGPVGGAALQLAGAAAAGSLGSGRLSELGPSGWGMGLWGTAVISAGALLGVAATRGLRRPAAT